MKTFTSFLIAAVLVGLSQTSDPLATTDKFLSINDLVDGALAKVRKIIPTLGYDPMPLPDYETSFLHIGLLGKLQLTECQLYNLSTVFRSQDVEFERLDGLNFHVLTAVKFDHLKLNCTYTASLLAILRKKGEAVVNLPNLQAEADLNIEASKLAIHLNELQLENKGAIDVHLEGGLLDGLGSILTQTISNLFKNVIIHHVQEKIEDALKKILEGEGEKEIEQYILEPISAKLQTEISNSSL